MRAAWDAAVAAWRAFIGRLVSGELIASGVHPASGIRSDLDQAEWRRSGSVLDVREGDLFTKERGGQLILRWTSITLRPAQPVRPAIPEQKLGRIDWDDWWTHEKARRQQGLLPNERGYISQVEPLIKDRYGVATVPPSELRRIKAALYRGDSERPKRAKRKQPRRKG
jgi:hypothetical protein